jgi:hypothetical protein
MEETHGLFGTRIDGQGRLKPAIAIDGEPDIQMGCQRARSQRFGTIHVFRGESHGHQR